MIAVDRLVPAHRRILETIGFLLGGEHANILAHGSLIALERDDVVTTTPSIAIMSSKAGMATISLDFSATAACPMTRR